MTAIHWQCPLCKGALKEHASGLNCEAGHSYDRAKQGYVNLLLANKKKSAEPGDSAEMISARQAFLSQGLYAFLARALAEKIQTLMGERECSLIDVGCGEAYYLTEIAQYVNIPYQFWGVDISKPAVKRAAVSLKEGRFAVASCIDLPLPAQAFDIALNIFAPLSASEIKRVLKPGGILLRVSPGPRHLEQFKALLYKEVKAHDAPKILDGGHLLSETNLTETTVLSSEQIKQLLAMTPLNWHGDRERKADLQSIESLELCFDFVVQEIRFE